MHQPRLGRSGSLVSGYAVLRGPGSTVLGGSGIDTFQAFDAGTSTITGGSEADTLSLNTYSHRSATYVTWTDDEQDRDNHSFEWRRADFIAMFDTNQDNALSIGDGASGSNGMGESCLLAARNGADVLMLQFDNAHVSLNGAGYPIGRRGLESGAAAAFPAGPSRLTPPR